MACLAGPDARRTHDGYLAHKLELTDAQQAQVKAIMAKEKPTLQPLMLQMAQDHPQMRELVMSGRLRRSEGPRTGCAADPDHDRTHGAARPDRVGDVQVLTPDQKTKLSSPHQLSTNSGS